MTRIGKIARLPKAIQDQLNHRLENNELGQPLLQWLNGLPEVRQVLAALFEGVPISKQNLSQWRRGGFREWQDRQDALKMVPDLSAAEELQPRDGAAITDKLAPWLVVRYFMIAKTMLATGKDAAGFKFLRAVCADVSKLRRDDHRLARLRLNQERLVYQHEPPEENPRAVAPSQSESKPVNARFFSNHVKPSNEP